MTDDQIELAKTKLRLMYAAAPTRKELAWRDITLGCDPAYVALKYGMRLEDMQRARNVHLEREEKAKARPSRAHAYQES